MKSATFHKNFDIVFGACKKALKDLDITIETADKNHKTITGTSAGSFWSWGENVQINFEMVNVLTTKIEVESTSQAQLISWGTNEENENKIISRVKEILQKQ
jgi:hypothetical protein